MSKRAFNNFDHRNLKQPDPRIKVLVTPSEANQLNQRTIKYKVDNGPKNELHANKEGIEIKRRRIMEEGQLNRRYKKKPERKGRKGKSSEKPENSDGKGRYGGV